MKSNHLYTMKLTVSLQFNIFPAMQDLFLIRLKHKTNTWKNCITSVAPIHCFVPKGAIIHVVTVSNQAVIKRLDAFEHAGCIAIYSLLYSSVEVMAVHSCWRNQINFNNAESAQHMSSCRPSKNDKTPVHAACLSMLGA